MDENVKSSVQWKAKEIMSRFLDKLSTFQEGNFVIIPLSSGWFNVYEKSPDGTQIFLTTFSIEMVDSQIQENLV